MMDKVYKFNEFLKENDDIEMDKEDLTDLENDKHLEDESEEKGEVEIESVLDVISEEDLEKYDSEDIIDVQENLTKHMDLDGKDYKRGDIIYISALVRKPGSTSFNSPARTAVLKCRITDIHYGLQYLNKVINK